MSTTEQPAGPHGHNDTELAEFGYKPELKRTLGNFHTFAAGISYISILTGTFQLFYFGYGSGGPAYWWSWPMVFIGQFMAALCFAELAARYPVAGSVYNWSKKIGNPHLRWGAVLFVAVIAGGGFAYYWFVQRHRTGVLAEHSLEGTAKQAAPGDGPVVSSAVD